MLTCDEVVVATGGYQVPIIPPYAARIPAHVEQIHAARYRNGNPAQLPTARCSSSAPASRARRSPRTSTSPGRTVHLAVGVHPASARTYRGRDVMTWLADMGLYDTPVAQYPGGAPAREKTNHYVTGGTAGATSISALSRERAWSSTVNWSTATVPHSASRRRSPRPSTAPTRSTTRSAPTSTGTSSRRVSTRRRRRGTNPSGNRRANPPRSIWRRRGSRRWCGHRVPPRLSWIEASAFDGAGRPMQTRGISEVPGLSFIGLPWMHTRGARAGSSGSTPTPSRRRGGGPPVGNRRRTPAGRLELTTCPWTCRSATSSHADAPPSRRGARRRRRHRRGTHGRRSPYGCCRARRPTPRRRGGARRHRRRRAADIDRDGGRGGGGLDGRRDPTAVSPDLSDDERRHLDVLADPAAVIGTAATGSADPVTIESRRPGRCGRRGGRAERLSGRRRGRSRRSSGSTGRRKLVRSTVPARFESGSAGRPVPPRRRRAADHRRPVALGRVHLRVPRPHDRPPPGAGAACRRPRPPRDDPAARGHLGVDRPRRCCGALVRVPPERRGDVPTLRFVCISARRVRRRTSGR